MSESTASTERVATVAPVDAEPGALAGTTCAVCLTTIDAAEAACLCRECRSSAHRACWDEIGGCATYGCVCMAEATAKEAHGDQASGWGDAKECPCCHETIKAAALKCRFCKTSFPSSTPMSESELLEWERQRAGRKSTRTAAVILFIVSLLGFLAPLVLLTGLPWLIHNREALLRSGGMYAVLAAFGVAISVFYSVILLVVCF